jgi:hypothetical protein
MDLIFQFLDRNERGLFQRLEARFFLSLLLFVYLIIANGFVYGWLRVSATNLANIHEPEEFPKEIPRRPEPSN